MSTAAASANPTIERLEDQIGWYDRKSMSCQRIFRRLKVIEIVSGALIPFIATARFTYRPSISATLGVLIPVLKGILQESVPSNEITDRSTCEALKHEKYVYDGKPPPRRKSPTRTPFWPSASNPSSPRSTPGGPPPAPSRRRLSNPARNILNSEATLEADTHLDTPAPWRQVLYPIFHTPLVILPST